MAKLVSIALSLLLLLQSFQIHIDDVVEFDELIEHAQFHAKEYGDNFFVFISKHYGDMKAQHSEQHQEEHEQLPFQHQTQITSLSVFVLNRAAIYTTSFIPVTSKVSNFFHQDSYHFLAQERLFQPPRLA